MHALSMHSYQTVGCLRPKQVYSKYRCTLQCIDYKNGLTIRRAHRTLSEHAYQDPDLTYETYIFAVMICYEHILTCEIHII